MKLRTFLKKQDAEAIVYIGSESGYMYIGPAGDLKAIEYFLAFDKRAMPRRIAEAKKTLRSLILGESRPVVLTGNDELDFDRIMSRAERIADKRNTIIKGGTYLKSYKEPLERNVRETYELESGGIAVIITGTENGRFWSKTEFDRVKK